MDVSKEKEFQRIGRIKQGSKSAFSELYDDYSGALYAVCIHLLKDEAEAQDALQGAMTKIWTRFDSYDEKKAGLYTWMLNITRNDCIDRLRKKGRKPQIQDISTSVSTIDSSGKSVRMDVQTNAIGLKEAVGKLKTEHKFVINAAYFGGYTQQEISEEFEIPLGTVKTRMRTALIELRKIFR